MSENETTAAIVARLFGVTPEDVVMIDGRPTIDGMEPVEWYEAVHGDEIRIEVPDDAVPDGEGRVRFFAYWLNPQKPHGMQGQVFYADPDKFER